ncbi:hypothetical protein HPB48_025566 [Haemaphysalis longicornis]|uniref:HAT C-terminal dimerisation domain-containing protein n=1 Tax=Haemaphysalis longicornis TaxID=44386 RepID=A0A9J6H945_HAELO|nr:hypothetical protein HPB48_025566 [Haemaphysalis longicornis]
MVVHKLLRAHTAAVHSECNKGDSEVRGALFQCPSYCLPLQKELASKKPPKRSTGEHGLEPLEVTRDLCTPWNSEYEMMCRLLKLRQAISVDLSGQDTIEYLTCSEWRLMAAVMSFLKCVEEATRELSSEKHPTLSQVIPLVHCMQILLSRRCQNGGEDAAFAGNLLRSMKSRFVDSKMQSARTLSTLAVGSEVQGSVLHRSRREKNHLYSAVEKVLPAHSGKEADASCTPAPVISDVWVVFGALASTNSSQASTRQQPQEEVEDYLRMPVIPRSENPYLWWKNTGKSRYPVLSRIALIYLSIPATQVSSERLFSASGNVVTCRRQLLLPERVEQLVFIHSNSSLLK